MLKILLDFIKSIMYSSSTVNTPEPITNPVFSTIKWKQRKMATKEKTTNYTDAQVELLKQVYDSGHGMTAKEIAALPEFAGKSSRSITGKLVSLGIYVKVEQTPKAAKSDEGPSKKELQAKLLQVGFSEEVVNGLAGANKTALQAVLDRFGAESANDSDAAVA